MDFPTLNSRTSLFLILVVLGGNFLSFSYFNKTICKQTMKILIRRRMMRRLIWVCTICLCHIKRTLGLYGLTHLLTTFANSLDLRNSSFETISKLYAPSVYNLDHVFTFQKSLIEPLHSLQITLVSIRCVCSLGLFNYSCALSKGNGFDKLMQFSD